MACPVLPTTYSKSTKLNNRLPSDCCLREEPSQKSLTITYLQNPDFSSGTYRIRNPGYYVLKESIVFNPSKVQNTQNESSESEYYLDTSEPECGWFAAISVECSNVIIDLNRQKLECAQEFIDRHVESIFALIELGNSPFPGDEDGDGFGHSGTSFPEDNTYHVGASILIKNGTLRRSSHWGIHGNNNSNLTLTDLKISDCEVAAISLNGLMGGSFTRLEINGCSHPIRVRSIMTAAHRLQNQLEILPKDQYPESSEYLDKLRTFVTERPDIFRSPLTLPDGSSYGILLTNGQGTNLALRFPINSEIMEAGQLVSNGRRLHCILFDTVSVSNVAASPQETVGIGSIKPGPEPYGYSITLAPFGLFGMMRWEDAFDRNGTFTPNPFLQAQAYLALTLLNREPEMLAAFPENIHDLLNSILLNQKEAFLLNAKPIFGRNFTLVENKGAFGIRIDCCSHLIMKNCRTENILNKGAPSKLIKSLPGGEAYQYLEEDRYIGNDVRGFAFSVVDDLRMFNCSAIKVMSLNGDAFGFDLVNEDSDVYLMKCYAKIIAGSSDIFPSGNADQIVNLPSEAYGFRIQNNSGPIMVYQSKVSNVQAPRFAMGFFTNKTNKVIYRQCKSTYVQVTSPEINGNVYPKRSFGFLAEKTNQTQFIRCFSHRNENIGETGYQKASSSLAIGFGFSSDRNSILRDSSTSYNRSERGRAIGILLDKSESILISRNICSWNSVLGFGIVDKTSPTKSTIVGNLLFGNRTTDLLVEPVPLIQKASIPSPSEYTIFKRKTNVGIEPEGTHDFRKLIIDDKVDHWIITCGNLQEIEDNANDANPNGTNNDTNNDTNNANPPYNIHYVVDNAGNAVDDAADDADYGVSHQSNGKYNIKYVTNGSQQINSIYTDQDQRPDQEMISPKPSLLIKHAKTFDDFQPPKRRHHPTPKPLITPPSRPTSRYPYK